MRFGVNLAKPFRAPLFHALHRIDVRYEQDELAAAVRDMFFEDHIQTVSLFDCSAQCLQIFLGLDFHRLILCSANLRLIAFQVFFIGKDGNDIFWRRQNSSGDCFPQTHFRCHIHRESSRCVLLPVQIAYVRRGQANHNGIARKKRLHRLLPGRSRGAVHLIQNHSIRMHVIQFYRLQH